MNAQIERIFRVAAIYVALTSVGDAKPIAFANGTTVMAEYGAHLSLNSELNGDTRDFTHRRLNYLAKRWNLPAAQANVFVWGSAGRAHIGETGGNEFAWNVGGQADYETRRVYASLRTDLYEASAYSHRIDTLQLGLAPYEHDYETLATWFVIQARQYTGGLYDGTEFAALIRLFKRSTWIEAG